MNLFVGFGGLVGNFAPRRGFEPETTGLLPRRTEIEGQCYIQAKPRAREALDSPF